MRKEIFYRILQLTLIPLFLSFVKRVDGLDNVPKSNSFVVVANHTSYIDPFIIRSVFHKYLDKVIFYLVKKEIYNNRLIKWFLDSCGGIPVDRLKDGRIGLNSALGILKEGKAVGIFPEGTRSHDGKLHNGKTGAARLALFARCPILPIGIQNTFELWPRHNKIPKLKKSVVVKVGKSFTLEKYYKKRITNRLLHNITDEIMLRISKLSGQEYVKD